MEIEIEIPTYLLGRQLRYRYGDRYGAIDTATAQARYDVLGTIIIIVTIVIIIIIIILICREMHLTFFKSSSLHDLSYV